MALRRAPKPTEPEPPAPVTHGSGPQKEAVPTPSRREAEAARRQRLNPSLSPKEARKRQRVQDMQRRQKTMASQEAQPERQLMRDHVDSRFNLGEFAMPIFMLLLVLTLIPGFVQWMNLFLVVSWGYILGMVLDTFLMWRKYKRLASERLGTTYFRGLLMYGFNRQLSFRRWRQPPPRVKRGEAI